MSADLDTLISTVLDGWELEYRRHQPGRYTVKLPGTRKLATMCQLEVGPHSLLVEAFVMRRPEENREQLYEFLLQRNARMYGVSFGLDQSGDVYLTGRVALHAVTEEELDRVLGSVLSYADENFNILLEIGFGSSIRREWAWRVKNGESLANLAAFAHLVAHPDRVPDESDS